MTPDRVAEALAALEAAEQTRKSRELPNGDVEVAKFSEWYKAQELELKVVPALLEIARAAALVHRQNYRYPYSGPPEPAGCMCPRTNCPEFVALAALAKAVLSH
jgi:hypothetical protein